MHESEQILARISGMTEVAYRILDHEHLKGPGTPEAAILKADLATMAATLAESLRNEHGKKHHDTTGS